MKNSINRHLKLLNDLSLGFYGFSGSFSFDFSGSYDNYTRISLKIKGIFQLIYLSI